MQIQTDVSLKDYSTMRLGGVAKALAIVESKQDLHDAVQWARERHLPVLPLGGGSNVIFSDGYAGLVIVNRITGYDVVADNPTSTTIRVGAGETWDSVVERSVQANLHGIELLSAIPGTAGASPVQNVGAYGASISQTFIELDAYDSTTETFVTFDKEACKFSYRNSAFKLPENKRFIIANLTFRLLKTKATPPFYPGLQEYFDQHTITDYTPQHVREAVIAVRARKLPDPKKVANTGSFFINPILLPEEAQKILANFPDAPHWELNSGRIKFSAGWLIEHAGLRGYSAHGMKTYEHHALVLINDSAKSYEDLLAFKNEIVAKVEAMYGITLRQEPELL
ncbi:MAG TPA: UDP-N-acetylmuramate dehydrogenase [Magnetospirillaceae bacterium]|nr:UDP-N-acetylmuramate dehydrogenase [Magnetospirillaceae bacterium]